MSVLTVKGLKKDYGTFAAVKGVSFEIDKGEVLGLLGPNGAGKSTTIQMLLGITEPTAGKIQYFGQDFFTNRQACLSRINFASAYNTLQGRMTVNENLFTFAGLYGLQQPMAKISELLDYFEIQSLAKHKYWDLSAGERTRVNLCKALLNDPELVLMDEPTASLDPDIADKTLSLIEQLKRERNLSILFTSHNMGEVSRICDQVIFLEKGRVVSADTPANHIKRLSDVRVVLTINKETNRAIAYLAKQGFEAGISHRRLELKLRETQIASVIADLSARGFLISDVEVNKPDLEDVFLETARTEVKS